MMKNSSKIIPCALNPALFQDFTGVDLKPDALHFNHMNGLMKLA
jgi:hypothetical protein